ncbi:MAG: alanine racemase [Gammaproteobacteria bacterium]
MTAFACADINREALQHNLSVVRKLAPDSKVMAVIKANAYGHGIEQVARALDTADALAVARISEAMDVRYAGIDKPVVLLEGVMRPKELGIASMYNLEIVVHREDQVDALEHYKGVGRFNVWLKIDTGMNRLGFQPDDMPLMIERLKKKKCVRKPIRVMSHFASADLAEQTMSLAQIKRFAEATDGVDGECTFANSAGILNYSESHADWVRPGAMLYGISPIHGKTGADLGLKPVMTLWSRVIAVKKVKAGQTVGYAGTYVVPSDTTIGIVAAGYGDGYPWRTQSGTPVLVNGRQYPLVGRVSMDMIAVDLGDKTDVSEGDKSILWGQGLPVETIAESAGSIPYELVCGISKRVRVAMLNQ